MVETITFLLQFDGGMPKMYTFYKNRKCSNDKKEEE